MNTLELVAQIAHEANRAYCLSIGDTSQPHWEDAPEWQRTSCLAGVRAVCENPERTPAESHGGWLALKEAEGWTYGEVKDAEKKTHPCMLPYDELPGKQVVKDALFLAVVKSALSVL